MASRETNDGKRGWRTRQRATAGAAVPGVGKQSWIGLFSPLKRDADLLSCQNNVTAQRRLQAAPKLVP